MDLEAAFAGIRALHPATLDGSRDKLYLVPVGMARRPVAVHRALRPSAPARAAPAVSDRRAASATSGSRACEWRWTTSRCPRRSPTRSWTRSSAPRTGCAIARGDVALETGTCAGQSRRCFCATAESSLGVDPSRVLLRFAMQGSCSLQPMYLPLLAAQTDLDLRREVRASVRKTGKPQEKSLRRAVCRMSTTHLRGHVDRTQGIRLRGSARGVR